MSQEPEQTVTVTTKNTAALVLGILALILGIGALLVSWIPFLGLVALPVAAIGLLLAFIGCLIALFKKFRGFVLPFVGGILSVAAIIVSFVVTQKSSVAWNEAMEESDRALTAPAAPVEDPELKSYIAENLEVYDVEAKYRESVLDGRIPGIVFKIRNNGDRTLSRVKVICYFLDADGNRIAEEDYHPVLVTKYGTDPESKPLRPGYVRGLEKNKFYAAKSVSDEWKEGSVDLEIIDIEFAEEEEASE